MMKLNKWLIFLVLLVIGAIVFAMSSKNTTAPTVTTDQNAKTVSEDSVNDSIPSDNPVSVMEFTREIYDDALATDKLVILYFYANWCPVCREEFPAFQSALQKFSADYVIAIRVNFNDSEVTSEEEAVAKEFNVPYQHYKVFLRGGETLKTNPNSWNEARYVQETSEFL